ncbi:MAG TPA: hypothetical protein VGW12_12750 [Pyrinomonadaceae bacterium]|nr:hypothetical protein [Pyrinomonadaceae bacterium]
MPPASGYPNIEILGMKLPLPKWAFYTVVFFALLGAGIPVFTQLIVPVMQEFRATSNAETAKAEVERAKADKEAVALRAEKEKIEQQLAEFREYQFHYGQDPISTRELFNNPDLGLLSVSYFNTDGCLRVTRRGPGQSQAVKTYWIPAKSFPLDSPPGKLEGLTGASRQETTRDQSFLNTVLQNATNGFAFFNPFVSPPAAIAGRESSAQCGGRCSDPHPGQFQFWNGQQNGCWIQVWRRWPEGCQHYQWFNSCNGYWDNYPNGAPRVYWTCCVH